MCQPRHSLTKLVTPWMVADEPWHVFLGGPSVLSERSVNQGSAIISHAGRRSAEALRCSGIWQRSGTVISPDSIAE